jgi:aspartyl-tRNA(Asn)/glutamyl-tRNA(Gln) amidotransferase subunit A
MNDIAFLTASELAPLIKTRQLSPVELTEHILNRIEKYNQTIHAYITILNDRAMKQAKEAEEQIMHGQYKGPLHGIPMGIKDNYQTKGIRTTAGSKTLADFIPTMTATSVSKLLDAGGIMLGKLNMHPLGAGLTGVNPFYGASRNPWNLQHMTGGSSGGSTAALAAGLAILTTGTDTFGSIRVPASMSGVYGLKPTYGLISTNGLIPAAWSLDHAGPFARSVSDLALMLYYMAGYDPNEATSLPISVPDYTSGLNSDISGMKIGIPTYYLEGLEPDIAKLFQRAVETFRSLGAEIEEIEIPELSLSTFAGYTILAGEASASQYEGLQSQPQDYAQDAKVLLLSGTLIHAPQYLKAQQARRKMAKAFKRAFEKVDILLGPTIPITTPSFQENWVEQNLDIVNRCLPFTAPANLAGIPSLSVPMGMDSKGLPAGMQLMGNHLTEQKLLQAGYAWEKTEPLGYRL